jgi:hypothetical protein
LNDIALRRAILPRRMIALTLLAIFTPALIFSLVRQRYAMSAELPPFRF